MSLSSGFSQGSAGRQRGAWTSASHVCPAASFRLLPLPQPLETLGPLRHRSVPTALPFPERPVAGIVQDVASQAPFRQGSLACVFCPLRAHCRDGPPCLCPSPPEGLWGHRLCLGRLLPRGWDVCAAPGACLHAWECADRVLVSPGAGHPGLRPTCRTCGLHVRFSVGGLRRRCVARSPQMARFCRLWHSAGAGVCSRHTVSVLGILVP